VSYYLGIDGGGTKTTCVVGDESSLLARATSGPSNIVRVGESSARESLHQCVRQACAAAGITPSQIAHTCVGGAGAARPELAASVRGALVEILSTSIDVVGDMHIALEAAFGAGPGVIVIAGTGSIAYGRDAEGNTARAGGWGFAISDEGSAHWIGRAAVSAALRAADQIENDKTDRNRSQKSHTEESTQTPLIAALLKAWDVTTIADLARLANSMPPPDFAALFPAVLASADDLSTQILARAAGELAQLAAMVVRRLFAEAISGSVPVAMIGGVFRHAQLVREIFYNELRRIDARVEINPNVVEPVEGALHLARRYALKSK
jgi:N-acetylglucosamine kinase-like BadF-type ATPase